jgi:DNA adenine methylase
MQAVPPFLRWAGSKRQIVPTLARFWNGNFRRYVEPFAGSACLFFHLAPRVALIGDINTELLATYRCVKYRHAEVARVLHRMKKGERQYYRVRALQPENLSPTIRAARFIYLNRFCFNGLFRTNSDGVFNVPYGGRGSGSLPSANILHRAAVLLKRATFLCGDFENVLDTVRYGDFVYMDPPFSISHKRMFKEYGAVIFGRNDVTRLRLRLELLAAKGISFVVSYVESPEAEYLSRGFDVSVVSVRRNIAGFTASRMKSQELIISNSS